LNVFRAVQKRLCIELREMGSRDRVMGDSVIIAPKENSLESIFDKDSETARTRGEKSENKTTRTNAKFEGESAYS
jgi:hypothetical protein